MNKNKIAAIVCVSLAITAFALRIAAVAHYSSPMPIEDDYDAILGFLVGYRDQPSQLWQLLAAQHNEHRLVTTRLIALADYKLFGHVDLVHLIWVGNLAWLAAIGAFWLRVKRWNLSLLELAPILIILMAFSQRELMTWAMASIQQYGQLAFAICALAFLTTNRPNAALIMFVASVFTGGGGLVLAPIIMAHHLIERRWGRLVVSVAITLATCCLYFVAIPYVPTSPKPQGASPIVMLAYALTFIGSAGRVQAMCIALGCAILLAAFRIRARLTREMAFLGWLALYIVLTAGIAAMSRGALGMGQARASRYTLYSLLFISIVYLGYLMNAKDVRQRARVVMVGMVFAVTLFVYWYSTDLPRLANRYRYLESGTLDYPIAEAGRDRFKRSCEIGILEAKVCAKAKQ